MKLVFATHNLNKFKEVKSMVPKHVQLLSLKDLEYHTEIEETGKTLEENALIKAKCINETFGLACIADDSGLFVEALNGEPGVYSARYGGPSGNDQKNIAKLLRELEGSDNRNAYFKTVICFKNSGSHHFFPGQIDGAITSSIRGNEGFGYDPIFVPNGYKITFAEMGKELKNQISHRHLAFKKFEEFAQNLD